MKYIPRYGFTLIELSIVLVIIGLIAGGVLVGRTMIRQSQLRTIPADVEKFQTAINTFRLKYNCQPGDCANATTFWGTNPNCATNGLGTGTQTCNGDGNKWTDLQTNNTRHMEQFTFWQHLSNAQLIEGVYTGQSNHYADCTVGVNCPGGRVSNRQTFWYGGWASSGDAWWWAYQKQHFIVIGNDRSWAAAYPGDPLVTAQEAYALDQKLDDGKPGLGKWRMFGGGYNPNCAIDSTDGTLITHAANQQQVAAYNIAYNGLACALQATMQ